MKTLKIAGISGVTLLVGVMGTATASADTAQLTDLDKTIASQLPYCNVGKIGDPQPIIKIDSTGVTSSHVTAVQDGDPDISVGDSWYLGTSELTNSTDKTIKLTSQSFTKAISESVKNSVSQGLKVTNKISAKFQITKGISIGDDFTTEYSFNSTTESRKEETFSFTSPPQEIDVPPHTVAHVTVNLQKVEATGKVALKATLGGTFDEVQYARDHSYGIGEKNLSLYDCLSTAQKTGRAPALPSTLTLDDANKKVKFNGTGTYTATYGTNYLVNVTFAPQVPGATVPKPFSRTISTNEKA
ncbi:ETX/MTX2 family pore-forming toxin [Streptomyces sp. NPDC059169]|uniref:ETX/MTX2 family pore-forming toxin n=1 Tax=Streptomyces sp. NPDC059169 TaxID=3346754 RepID=UPI0036B2F6CC